MVTRQAIDSHTDTRHARANRLPPCDVVIVELSAAAVCCAVVEIEDMCGPDETHVGSYDDVVGESQQRLSSEHIVKT